MEHSPFLEARSYLANQEIPFLESDSLLPHNIDEFCQHSRTLLPSGYYLPNHGLSLPTWS
jgi:hypothetical protein